MNINIQVPKLCYVDLTIYNTIDTWKIRQIWYRFKAWFPIRKFYFLDQSTGEVKWKFLLKRAVPKMGRSKMMEVKGKWICVYIDDWIPKAYETIFGWSECSDNGFYDKSLQTFVKSKDHYRQLMKEKGLRQKEDYKYCKSSKQAYREKVKEDRAKFEENFKRTLAQMPPSYKDQL